MTVAYHMPTNRCLGHKYATLNDQQEFYYDPNFIECYPVEDVGPLFVGILLTETGFYKIWLKTSTKERQR